VKLLASSNTSEGAPMHRGRGIRGCPPALHENNSVIARSTDLSGRRGVYPEASKGSQSIMLVSSTRKDEKIC